MSYEKRFTMSKKSFQNFMERALSTRSKCSFFVPIQAEFRIKYFRQKAEFVNFGINKYFFEALKICAKHFTLFYASLVLEVSGRKKVEKTNDNWV